jgi:peptide-methionine (S)-S-oxide reductase
MLHDSGNPFYTKSMEPTSHAVAVFGGGCFWCTEAVFTMLKGVVSVAPGYAGGTVEHPSYEQVSSGTTGHVEVIRFEFDPSVISYEDLLNVFFATHDPTTLNRQGNDVGPQYASVIFFSTPEQKEQAESFIQKLNAGESQGVSIVTRVRPLGQFWPAEDYHKQYYEHHKNESYCQIVINPKLDKVKEKFAQLLKSPK